MQDSGTILLIVSSQQILNNLWGRLNVIIYLIHQNLFKSYF